MATKYLTLAAGGLAYALSYEEPEGLQVTGVSPDFTTITGSGFGTEGATNVVFDNFDDGTMTTTAKVGTWQSVNGLTATAEARHAGSAYSAYLNFDNTTNHGYLTGSNSILSRNWFNQYWCKCVSFDWGTTGWETNNRFLSSVKFLRYWNPGDTIENFVMAFGWQLTDEAFSKNSSVDDAVLGNIQTYFPLTKAGISDGNWHCLQFEFVDSDPPGTANGVFKVWLDGALIETRTEILARKEDYLKRPMEIGFYNSWEPNTALGETARAPNHFYMSDVYSAPTLSRVEIGDNAVYGNCTHREVQVPTAWSDTSITVTPYFGSFAAESSVYLFVVDPNGTPSSGYGPIVTPAEA